MFHQNKSQVKKREEKFSRKNVLKNNKKLNHETQMLLLMKDKKLKTNYYGGNLKVNCKGLINFQI